MLWVQSTCYRVIFIMTVVTLLNLILSDRFKRVLKKVYNTHDYWVFGLCPSSGILTNTMFGKLNLFLSSDEGWDTPPLLGPLESLDTLNSSIVSLFSNVPVNKTRQVIRNLLHNDDTLTEQFVLQAKTIMEQLEVWETTYFQTDDNFFQ
jgi:hypothetical protein